MSISREEAKALLAKRGITELPPDHPIYSEPPTARFVNKPRARYVETDLDRRLRESSEEILRRITLGMRLQAGLPPGAPKPNRKPGRET